MYPGDELLDVVAVVVVAVAVVVVVVVASEYWSTSSRLVLDSHLQETYHPPFQTVYFPYVVQDLPSVVGAFEVGVEVGVAIQKQQFVGGSVELELYVQGDMSEISMPDDYVRRCQNFASFEN